MLDLLNNLIGQSIILYEVSQNKHSLIWNLFANFSCIQSFQETY